MKKIYEVPSVEVTAIKTEVIICTSLGINENETIDSAEGVGANERPDNDIWNNTDIF